MTLPSVDEPLIMVMCWSLPGWDMKHAMSAPPGQSSRQQLRLHGGNNFREYPGQLEIMDICNGHRLAADCDYWCFHHDTMISMSEIASEMMMVVSCCLHIATGPQLRASCVVTQGKAGIRRLLLYKINGHPPNYTGVDTKNCKTKRHRTNNSQLVGKQ